MANEGDGPVLITIPISHYCEKARWALDRAGVAFRERRHLQVAHWIPVRRAGGRWTAPVLVCGDTALPDSSDILRWADARTPAERRLLPADGREADEVRALEREFDARLGPHGRRWMYDALRGHRDVAVRYAPAGVPAWERRLLQVAYPAVSRVIDRYLDIDHATVAASEREFRAVLDAVERRLGDGRPYLAGERFTAADLTFAALAAPLVMPPEYAVPLPQPDELPTPMAARVRELREHPAGAFALRMFREERRGAAAA